MYSLRKHFLANYAKVAFGSNSGVEGLLSGYCFGDGNGRGSLGVRCQPVVTNGLATRRYHSDKARRSVTIPTPVAQTLRELSSKLRMVEPFPSRRQFRYSSQSTGEVVVDKQASGTNMEDEKGTDEQNLEDSELNDEDSADLEGFDGDGSLVLTEEQLQELSQGDPELIKKIKFCQLEYAVLREEGMQVPTKTLKRRQWMELLELSSKSKRRKYYTYLFKNEMKELSDIRRKIERRKQRLEEFAEAPLPTKEEDIYGMCYTLARNTLFLRLYDTTINKFLNQRACSAIMHNPPLVLDCSYDEFMSPRESKNCAKQLELVLAENRNHQEPFSIHFCNAGRNTRTMENLHRMIPVLEDDNFIANIHEECFTELFPKKRLVYLTPHTREDLEEFDEDDIYIIGAMVDKSNPRPYSFAKAKKLGIPMRRLPLDKHLMWGEGGKSLTINQVVRIMLDVRFARGDWIEGLKCVPMRKLCRDFHPYPDQVDQQRERIESSGVQRKEKMSTVFRDQELINRRKGFRRSEMYTPNNYKSNSRIVAPNVKSIMYEYD